jgi:hypothetical protein
LQGLKEDFVHVLVTFISDSSGFLFIRQKRGRTTDAEQPNFKFVQRIPCADNCKTGKDVGLWEIYPYD